MGLRLVDVPSRKTLYDILPLMKAAHAKKNTNKTMSVLTSQAVKCHTVSNTNQAKEFSSAIRHLSFMKKVTLPLL